MGDTVGPKAQGSSGSIDALLALVAAAPSVEGAYAMRPLPVATIVGGRYRIEGVLGRGGTAVVYRARSLELRRVVAIKMLSVGADRERLRRLRAEASTMARLSHPHVLAVMDVGMHEDQLFLVMEHVEGGTLREWLERPRSMAAVLDAFAQAGEGLAAAHRLGIVHRDFKPDNALVGKDGRVRVSDFGLARTLSLSSETGRGPQRSFASLGERRRPSTWESGVVHGTPAYMAPEQLEGAGADPKSDQFAFCVALFEALHGQRPFAARTLSELREAVSAGRIDRVPRSRVPRRIQRVLLRGLRPSPGDRYPTMDALLHALRRARRPSTIAAGASIAALTLAALAAAGREPAPPQCAAPDPTGVWDEALKGEGARAFETSGAAGALETWARARDALDGYADEWAAARRRACAEVQASTQSAGTDLDLRLSCLDRRRDDLAAVASVLARADDRVVNNAVDLVSHLAPVGRCDDADALRRDAVEPPDPRIAARAGELRARLSIASANANAGRFPTGIAIAQEVADAARGLGYAPLEADALLVLGTTASKQGRHEEASDAMRQAYFAAVEAGLDRAALRAALGLASRLGHAGGTLEEALKWAQMGEALVHRLGDEPRDQAELEGSRAEAYYNHARAAEAIEGFRRALALLEAHEPEGTLIVPVRTTLANALMMERRFDECVEVASASVDVATKIYGELHSSTAMGLGTLAQCRASAGDAAAAEAPARKAVEILEAAQGRLSMNVADAYDALGSVLKAQGKIDEAIEANARVREIQDAVNPGDTYNRAVTLANLALLHAARGDLDEADSMLRGAIEIVDDDTPGHVELRQALEAALANLSGGADGSDPAAAP